MVRLPSLESNSSDAETSFKPYFHTRTNNNTKKRHNNEDSFIAEVEKKPTKNDVMSESSPVKNNYSNYGRVIEDIATDEEKSAGLYFMAFEKNSLE